MQIRTFEKWHKRQKKNVWENHIMQIRTFEKWQTKKNVWENHIMQ